MIGRLEPNMTEHNFARVEFNGIYRKGTDLHKQRSSEPFKS